MGPAWLGIGAQRSGTTWFSDLMLQHPEVNLSSVGKKELHELYRPDVDLEHYRGLFERPNSGEWTPFYLRAFSAPRVARSVLPTHAPILVLLRDPVDRFISAWKRWGISYRGSTKNPRARLFLSDATWAGMYADQLDVWLSYFPRERMMVMQYEKVNMNPQNAVDQVWDRLGLESVELTGVSDPSRTASSTTGQDFPPGMRTDLIDLYATQVRRLQRTWGIAPSLWPNFE